MNEADLPGTYRERQRYDEDRISYLQPTFWWFLSTAFPLIAGTFGPLANLFSVCALVHPWRLSFPSYQRIPDPPWLIALNCTSLVLALLANVLLLLNFAHRLSYKLAQVLTILLWYLSSVLLTAPLALTHLPSFSPPSSPHILSQSFYYALISTIIYSTISTLLLLNLLGALMFHAYEPNFLTLTMPQRTLMLQTISFSLYLALGAGVFSSIENWNFVDAVYWADYTLLTVGLGTDFPLKTTLGRMLLIPYAAFGITLIGLVVSSVRGLVLERGKVKVVRRRLGKERERLDEKKWLRVEGVGAWKKAEYDLMRQIERSALKIERYSALATSFFVFLIVWIGGALVFWTCEHDAQSWTYPESLFFTYTSLLTIGYGDFFPASQAGKPFFVVWSLIAIPAVTCLISNMGDTIVRGVEEATVWMGRKTVLPEKDECESDSESGNKAKKWKKWRPKRIVKRKNKNHDGERLVCRSDNLSTTNSNNTNTTHAHTNAPTTISNSSSSNNNITSANDNDNSHEKKVNELALKIATEIQKIVKDVTSNPSKKYEWEEWQQLLALILEEVEEVEGGSNRNRDVDADREKWKEYRKWKGKEKEMEKERQEWTWLGDGGPLFSKKSESEWVLERLCNRLQHVLDN